MISKIMNKNLNGFTGEAWLFKFKNKYYVASGTSAPLSGWEVLIFKSDEKGKIKNWAALGGGRDMSHEEAIDDFEEGYKDV